MSTLNNSTKVFYSYSWRIIGLAVVLRLLFIVGCPVEQINEPFTLSAFNDELSHYNYAVFYANNHYRPIQEHNILESYPQGLNDYEYYQPPLYYRLAGYFLNILPEKTPGIYILRSLNLVISILLILTIGRIVLLIEPGYVFASMIFLTIHPTSVFFGSAVTNDVLLWLMCSLGVYYGILLIKTSHLKYRIALCLCVSCAVWIKLSALAMIPALGFAIYLSYPQKGFIIKTLKTLMWCLFTIIWTVPLLWENYDYYGSILPMNAGLGQAVNAFQNFTLKKIFLSSNYIVHSFYFPFENYWIGTFQAVFFLVLGIISLIIVYLAFRYYYFIFKQLNKDTGNILIFLGLTILMAVGGLTMMTFRYNQSEARLTFLALPAIVILLMKGIDQLLLTLKLNIAKKRKIDLADVIQNTSRNHIEKAVLFLTAIPYLLFVIN